MQRLTKLSVAVLLSFSVVTFSVTAKAEATREFLMSATYGALAGTLVGAATLAFSDKPGDNLNKVARGASLGLYAGILLGLYVAYGGNSDEEDAAAQLRNTTYRFHEAPNFLVAPLLSERGLEGAQASYTVVHF